MKMMIGVIGTGANDSERFLTSSALNAAEAIGREIAKRGGVLVSGGLSGIMQAASKGAKQEGGMTLGFLPGTEKGAANPYIDLPIPTGLGHVRNYLTIRASNAVIMINGGLGTLNELTIAIGERITPVVVLEGTGAWADRIRSVAYEGLFLDERRSFPLHFASTPEAAVDLAMTLAAASA